MFTQLYVMKELLKSHFDNSKTGPFRLRSLKQSFPSGSPSFLMGRFDRFKFLTRIDRSYGAIVPGVSGNILKAMFPAGKFGPLPGLQWKVSFQPSLVAELKYKLFVPARFDFVKGGKLPGLAGGTGNTGGHIPTGRDGWSVRFMFKEAGKLCAYAYYPGMREQFGEKMFLKKGEQFFQFPIDQWVEITLRIEMNDPGHENGSLECRVDNELLLQKNDMEFRRSENLRADHFLFSTFFGGAGKSWAPGKDCELFFKDIVVSGNSLT